MYTLKFKFYMCTGMMIGRHILNLLSFLCPMDRQHKGSKSYNKEYLLYVPQNYNEV